MVAILCATKSNCKNINLSSYADIQVVESTGNCPSFYSLVIPVKSVHLIKPLPFHLFHLFPWSWVFLAFLNVVFVSAGSSECPSETQVNLIPALTCNSFFCSTSMKSVNKYIVWKSGTILYRRPHRLTFDSQIYQDFFFTLTFSLLMKIHPQNNLFKVFISYSQILRLSTLCRLIAVEFAQDDAARLNRLQEEEEFSVLTVKLLWCQ